MATKRNENYITDKVLVPYYNQSQAFRKFISKQFGRKFNFGDYITVTCDKRFQKDGCPDAASPDGKNFIEVKIHNNTKLTANEKKGGAYEKKLKKNPNSHLLYIVPACYKYSNDFVVVKKQVTTITWNEIYNFMKEQNDKDQNLSILLNNIDNLYSEQEQTVAEKHAEILKFLNNLNIQLSRKNKGLFLITQADFYPSEASSDTFKNERYIDFWYIVENNFFDSFDFETGIVNGIYLRIKNEEKLIKKIKKYKESIHENERYFVKGMNTDEFFKATEKQNSRKFIKKIEEFVKILS